jgi:hypothetical protein
MGEENSCNLDGIDKDILKQIELKRNHYKHFGFASIEKRNCD